MRLQQSLLSEGPLNANSANNVPLEKLQSLQIARQTLTRESHRKHASLGLTTDENTPIPSYTQASNWFISDPDDKPPESHTLAAAYFSLFRPFMRRDFVSYDSLERGNTA
ncbi:MAG TPA: hypothetical protein PLK77_00045 [Pyrinomonadaceae bacterium]|nr:hypothetical protein [Pyrinomonadaceae bacterium]